MKKIYIYFFTFFIISCNSASLELDDRLMQKDEAQIKACQKLFKYYIENKKDLNYCEITSKKNNLTLNYNPKIKVLLIYNVDGWQAVYRFVDENSFKRVYEANISFNKYDSLLVREENYNIKTMGKIKTSFFR